MSRKGFFISSLLLFNLYSAYCITLVNMGGDCQAAYYLRKYDLRKEAFPFDWIRSYNFEGICRLFENNFNYLLDPAYLRYEGYRIVHTLYGIEFVHDFPTVGSAQVVAQENDYAGTIVPNYLDFLDAMKHKFYTRIDRLVKAIKSGELIYFFRSDIGPAQAKIFVDLIKRKYPECNFKLVIIHSDPAVKYKWSVPNVHDFYAQTRVLQLNNWFNDDEWLKLFQELGLSPVLRRSLSRIDLFEIDEDDDWFCDGTYHNDKSL